MTPDDPAPPLRSQPGVRGCTLLCLTALMGVILALLENERELLGILLLGAVGAVAVVAHWRSGPGLLLVGLALLEGFYRATQPWYFRNPYAQESPFMDAVLSASVLVYVAGHARLMSMVHTVFPIDVRRPPPPPGERGRRRGPPLDNRQRRSAHLPGPWEMPALAIAAAVWGVVVSLFWLALSAALPPTTMSPGLWRGLLLIFILGLTTAVLAGAAGYLSWVMASPAEHLVFLQDQAWRETRREQNRINRWLVWARLRGQRRKEKT